MQAGRNQETKKDGIPLASRRRWIRAAILKYSLGGHRRKYPWRERGRSPYELLIAELLLKRTTATAAARIYHDVLKRFPTVGHLDRASQEKIANSLAPIGLQRQRAKSIKALARWLVVEEYSQVPAELARLLKVPGLGEYSARAIMSFAYNVPVAIVDSNVIRIDSRVFSDSIGKNRAYEVFQKIADALLPIQQHREFNLGLLDLGGLVCRPSRPLCPTCPLLLVCDYGLSNVGDRLENGAPLKTPNRLRETRRKKGMTLVEVARTARISKLTLIKMEKDETNARPETWAKVANALGVKVSKLREKSDVHTGV